MKVNFVYITIFVITGVCCAIYYQLNYITPNNTNIPYDSVRASIVASEMLDTVCTEVSLERVVVPEVSKQSTYTLIPKAECAEIGVKYLVYKFKMYHRKGYNPKTQIFEGLLISKGSIITICNYTLNFHHGIVGVKSCLMEYVSRTGACTKVKILH